MQACELREVFEEVNGKKECLQQCVTAMLGAFKKSQISRQLKAMGLKRNRLTESQVGSCTLHRKWGAGAHTWLMWALLGLSQLEQCMHANHRHVVQHTMSSAENLMRVAVPLLG